ncbi:MAG: hypothetical protein BGO55_25065 [Sphingobacteriales bacterium 50-39]|nr:hypothetical protein [Sphingobacteriales bacterium]OJW58554.1 MAG: hypothetical protein BGO55_25065 [Sphingobacteriales bacterium 50-39]
MRKTALAVCCLLTCISVFAQNDSSRLDAGSLVLKRNFTQHIAIKGEDLEKMPFSNLSDAINVWISGAYTVSRNLIYVVDGNIISDVCAYSIHDIEEVVFVQNANALTGTAANQQEMVLITTRNARNKGIGRPALRASSQTSLVNSPGSMLESYYHNYAGLDATFKKISVGVSGDYLQDVTPMPKRANYDAVLPYTMDRWRLNGNFTWRADTKNTVEVRVGYADQKLDSAQNYTPPGYRILNYNERSHESDKQFTSWARWRGEWLPGLRNDLQVGYIHFRQQGNYYNLGHFTDSSTYYDIRLAAGDYHIHHIYVRDRLSYTLHAGDWSFEPAFNASYQYLNQAYGQAFGAQSGNLSGGGFGGGSIINSTAAEGRGYKLYVLTPTLDITYKELLNIQGGVVENVSHKSSTGTSLPRASAFASIAIDILRIDGVSRTNSLKLFGSYAQRSAYYVTDFSLNDIDNANAPFKFPIDGNPQAVMGTIFTGGIIMSNLPVSIPKYWVWEAGASWSVLKNRLQIDYNFERRNLTTTGFVNSVGGINTYYFPDFKSAQHRVGVNVRIIDKDDISWQSGLNTTVLRTKIDPDLQSPSDNSIIGDHYPGNNKPSFTGGWTNRVHCHRVSVGMDVLYHFSGENIVANSFSQMTTYSRDNAWLAQNIYIGYKIALPEKMGLEVYVDSRGLVRGGNTPYMTTPSRYYGIGGKFSL